MLNDATEYHPDNNLRQYVASFIDDTVAPAVEKSLANRIEVRFPDGCVPLVMLPFSTGDQVCDKCTKTFVKNGSFQQEQL